MKTWSNMTAADLGRGIGAGKIHAVELAEFFLDKIDTHDLAARIYARTTPARARGEAMGAAGRAKAGLRRGPLDGVPLSWKDLFDTAGTATEAGSALLRGRTPTRDAAVLETATLGGLVCLGKTHMSELAFSGLGLNPVTATPPCINDARAVSGGSSSGAAASVAFGLAPAAMGSDTGGSARVPAAWNDLCGLKTTWGRLPLTGVVPLCERFDTVGFLAHSLEDCALMLAACEGARAMDLTAPPLAGLRLGVLETLALDGLRDAPAQGFDDALSRLTRAGARIERVAFPGAAEAMALAGPLYTGQAYGIWSGLIESAPDKMFAGIIERFRSGAGVSATDYVAGWRRLAAIRGAWAGAMAGFDAVILPTSPILPPDAARLLADAEYYAAENLLAMRNTRIGNLMDVPVVTLPTAQPSCGISFMGASHREERLIRLCLAAERALA